MQPELYATKRALIALRQSRHFGLQGLMLLLAVVASTPGFSAEAQSAYGNSNCIFVPATQIAAGTNPFSVAAGDLNGDGVMDIAVANEGSNDVSILLATGAGTFAAASSVVVGNAPRSVVIDDVSGDGKLDLVVANHGDDTLTVRLGTGTGTFGSPGTLPVGNGPRGLAVADLNKDGKRDLVVANGGDSVSVLLGTGGGAFAAAVTHAVAGNPISVAINDFNADGKADLAVASESNNTVSTLFGNGTGGFGAANPIALGSQPKAVVSGDLNADGKPDLAIANSLPDSVSILLGSSGGTFNAATQYPAHALGTAIALADLDGDGKAELVVANEIPWPTLVTVLRGLDGGTFAAPTWIQHLGGAIPRGVAAGDFNADGIPDLVLANYASDNVSILLGDCAPTMNIAPNAHVNLTSSYELRKSPVWFDRQTYSPFTTFTHVVAHADLDRDGLTDLLRASIESQHRVPLQVLMQTVGGDFDNRTNAVLTDAGPGLIWSRKGLNGDYNGDGWPDVLFLDNGDDFNVTTGEFNQLFLSNGDGTLRYSPVLEDLVGYHHGAASADIDGNGTIDVLIMNAGGAGEELAYFLINDGRGNFTRSRNRLPMELQEHSSYIFELVDVDRDGFIDLITAGGEYTEGVTPATIYWGSSTGLYRAPAKTVFPLPQGYGTVLDFAAEDIDDDGDKDVIIHRQKMGYTSGRYFQILRQVAPRQFVDESASRISMDTSLATVTFDYFRVQDINGDGSLDIFVDDKYLASKGEYAWTNNGQGVFAPYFGDVNPAVVIRQPADLALTVLDAASGTYAPGANLIVNNRVENLGGTASDAYRLSFYASTDTVITTADVSLDFEDFRSLFVGLKRSYSNTAVQLPASLPDGQYYIGAIVAVTDANTGNNTKYDPVPITVDSAQPAFQINAGHAGAWFNPATSGQGQLIDIEPGRQFMFLAWFTYTDDGSGNPKQQHWLTAQGNYSGAGAVLPVYETLGGKFDAPQAVGSTIVGSLELSFNDCANGSANYTIDAWGVDGSFPLTRVIPGSGNVCQGLADADRSGLVENDGWDGAWYDPQTSGQGFLIDAHPHPDADDFMFVAWFTYGDTNASGQRWLTAQGPMNGTLAELGVYETTGGSFDDTKAVSSKRIGTMTIEFNDCNSATLSYELTEESLSGSIDIIRVVPGSEALCEELASEN